MKKTRYITYCAVFCAIGALLPQAFHVFGEAAGKTLLPMHIPAMIAGFLLGPAAGVITGTVSPVLSSFITGGAMPIIIKVPFMMFEVGAYGLFCGVFGKKILPRTKLPEAVSIIASVFIAQIFGRIINAVCTVFAVYVLGVMHPAVQTVTLWAAVVSGIPGIVIQLVFVPVLVILLKKAAGIKAETKNTEIK